jgi:hypothetical protein
MAQQQNQNQNQQNQGQKNQFRDDDITSQTGQQSRGGITGSKGMDAGRSSDQDDDLDNEDVQFGSDDSSSSRSEDALEASNRNSEKRVDRPIGEELKSGSQGNRAAGTKKGMNQQQSSQGSQQGSQQRH